MPRSISVLAGFMSCAALALPAFAQSEEYAPLDAPLQLRSEALAMIQVCRADYDRVCPGVVPGGGRVLACLQAHSAEVSPNCARVLPRAQALRNRAMSDGRLPR